MTSLLTKTDLPSRIANRELTESERYEYASFRFGFNMLWVRQCRSGRVIVGNQARDAVAVVESYDELLEVLTIALKRSVTWADIENNRRVKLQEEEKQTKSTMKSLLDEIDI